MVVTSRNDDHGGSLLRRMQAFVDNLLEQCRRHALPAELVLVEWNPPADRPSLREALRWPTEGGPCAVRLITVPPERHARLRHASALPLFQMIGKNVGLRRARGQYLLATNVDILFSDELVAFLARQELQPGQLYRIDRHDVMEDVPPGASVDEQLAYCKSHLVRVHTAEGSLPLRPDGSFAGRRRAPLPRRLGRASVTVARAMVEATADRLRQLEPGGLPSPLGQDVAPLHVNACGDFTLLDRERWHDLRGYPELEIFSFHLDSVFCHAAHASGAPQVVLPEPMRIYHIEHGTGSGWTPEGQRALFARLRERGIPWLSDADLRGWASQMRRLGAPMIFNRGDWGFAEEALPEMHV